VNPRCAQKLARLKAIVAERAAWASQLAQVRRMHGWVLSVEHLLDESLAQEGEVVSNATVGSRLDGWREQMAPQLTDGTLSELEQECLTHFLLRYGRYVAYAAWWEQDAAHRQQLEQRTARLDRARWRQLRRETTAAQSEQLKRFRFRHRRQAYLNALEERWAAVAPTHPLP